MVTNLETKKSSLDKKEEVYESTRKETKDLKQDILSEKKLREHIEFARREMVERIEDIKKWGGINETESKKLKKVVDKGYSFMEANSRKYFKDIWGTKPGYSIVSLKKDFINDFFKTLSQGDKKILMIGSLAKKRVQFEGIIREIEINNKKDAEEIRKKIDRGISLMKVNPEKYIEIDDDSITMQNRCFRYKDREKVIGNAQFNMTIKEINLINKYSEYAFNI